MRWGGVGVAVVLAAAIGGCGTVHNLPGNQPLTSASLASAAIVDAASQTPSYTDNLLIGLSFSGGGTRAAAFAFGVLKELDQTQLPGSRDVPLTERIDFVSGVSGGSITAAYFGLRKRAGLADFRERFLIRNAEESLQTSVDAATLARGLSGGVNTSAFPRWLDENLFQGATFAELRADRRPRIWINASDIYNRTPFVFGRTAFSVLCSDLNSYRIAEAVAATAAVPVVFAPIVLESFADKCRAPLPQWADKARLNPNAPPMLKSFSDGLERYRDGSIKYIKLLDGGLVDNFGLSGFTIARQSAEKPYEPMTPEQAVKIRRAMFLVVDAGRGPSGDWAKSIEGPGGVDLIMAAADTAIDAGERASYAAFEQTNNEWLDQLIRWRCRLTAEERRRYGAPSNWNCRDLKFFMGRVGFNQLGPARESALDGVPTRFRLPVEQVDLVIGAGQESLRVNPAFRAFLRSL
jgi:NTE family protein